MQLTQDIAQKIVQKTKTLVDYVVNIMDTDGIIIASSDPKRIGEVHFGAQQVLRTKRSYVMNDERARKYKNVVPGISLPIRFHGKIVGVVGVGSGTESAKQYGGILQLTTELLLEQINQQYENNLVQKSRERFFRELLLGLSTQSPEYLKYQADNFEVPFESPWNMFLFKIWLNREDDGEIVKYPEHFRSRLRNTLEMNLFEYPKMQVVFAAENVATVFPYALNPSEHEKMAEKIYTLVKNIYKKEVTVCICEEADRMDQLPGLYERAVRVYKLADRITAHKVFRQNDFEMEYLFLKDNQQEIKEFSEKVFAGLDEEEMLLATLDAFFENNMSVSKTAEKLFIHRNTLTFRLNRIQQITGLAPTVFRDAMKLYLALLSRKAGN